MENIGDRKRQKREHYDRYESIAQSIGIARLINLVPYDKELLSNGYNSGDIHFNDCTSLFNWDMQHGMVSMLVGRMLFKRSWSLCDTVCVLKHVARYYIVCADIPEEV